MDITRLSAPAVSTFARALICHRQVLTVAEEGEVLVKWKRFCSLRPWCPVQKGDVQGWAGKDYLYELDD